jgi:hypothetical protein
MNDPNDDMWQGIMHITQLEQHARTNKEHWPLIKSYVEANFSYESEREHALELFEVGLYWLKEAETCKHHGNN